MQGQNLVPITELPSQQANQQQSQTQPNSERTSEEKVSTKLAGNLHHQHHHLPSVISLGQAQPQHPTTPAGQQPVPSTPPTNDSTSLSSKEGTKATNKIYEKPHHTPTGSLSKPGKFGKSKGLGNPQAISYQQQTFGIPPPGGVTGYNFGVLQKGGFHHLARAKEHQPGQPVLGIYDALPQLPDVIGTGSNMGGGGRGDAGGTSNTTRSSNQNVTVGAQHRRLGQFGAGQSQNLNTDNANKDSFPNI